MWRWLLCRFDALIGYLSALTEEGGEPSLAAVQAGGWPASVHIIGKDILRFHAVYWPGMLLSAGLPLPQRVFGHGFLTSGGLKMGKALGNVIDPKACAAAPAWLARAVGPCTLCAVFGIRLRNGGDECQQCGR